MTKWTKTLFGTSKERQKKHQLHLLRKNQRQKQKEDNAKIRTYYNQRIQKEHQLEQKKNTEKKDISKSNK